MGWHSSEEHVIGLVSGVLFGAREAWQSCRRSARSSNGHALRAAQAHATEGSVGAGTANRCLEQEDDISQLLKEVEALRTAYNDMEQPLESKQDAATATDGALSSKSASDTETKLECIASMTLQASDILTANECTLFIDAAQQRAERVGWGEERHNDYVTEDVKVWNLEEPRAHELFQQQVEGPLCDALACGYGLSRELLRVSDAFVVRYALGAKQSLDYHRDGSVFSGIISLSAGTDYVGGGTLFEDGDFQRPERGDGILFFGQRGHAGKEITAGSRFILTLFFDYDGFSTEELAEMLMLADDV